MTGRLSALSEFGEAASGVLAALGGGWMVTHASMSTILLIAAGCSAVILLQGFFKPRVIFSGEEEIVEREKIASVRVLLRHRAIWPTMLIIFLWSFSPGYHTPLLFYLTEDVGISSVAYGVCQAVDCIGVTAATVLYVWLCRHQPLRRLLWWSISLSVLPGLVFLLVRNAPQAVGASFLLAVLIGFMNTSIGDLLMRASPEGLEGSYRMIGVSAFAMGGAMGDVFGAWVYERSGLLPCLIVEAVLTLCIFPALRRLPPALIASREAESEE
jgi:predicted MFS family arabinose efflux permease